MTITCTQVIGGSQATILKDCDRNPTFFERYSVRINSDSRLHNARFIHVIESLFHYLNTLETAQLPWTQQTKQMHIRLTQLNILFLAMMIPIRDISILSSWVSLFIKMLTSFGSNLLQPYVSTTKMCQQKMCQQQKIPQRSERQNCRFRTFIKTRSAKDIWLTK